MTPHGERWFLLGLCVLVPITRLPFHGEFLYHWDSVNFALALDRFDMAAHQPHPPGYLLYVGLAQLVHVLVRDVNLALVWTSTLFEMAATAFFFLLARSFFPFAVAACAAVLFALQPFFVFHGAVALSHSAEAAFSAALAWVAVSALRGSRSAFWMAPLLLAAAGGVRQHLGVILFPLYAYATLRAPVGWSARLGSGLLLAAGIASWAVPLFVLSGGFDAYLAVVAAQSRSDLPLGSPLFGAGFSEAVIHVVHLFRWLLSQSQLLVFVVAAGAWWGRRRVTAAPQLVGGARLFLIAWISPILAFQIFVQLTRVGQTMVLYPATFLAVAWSLDRLAARWDSKSSGRLAWIAAAAIAADVLVFFAVRPMPLDASASARGLDSAGARKAAAIAWNDLAAAAFSRAEIRRMDDALASRLALLRLHPPESAVLAPEFAPRGETGNWSRHLTYYAPHHRLLALHRGAESGVLDTGSPPRDVLFFVDDFATRPDRPPAARHLSVGVWLLPASSLPARYGPYQILGTPGDAPESAPR